jgi:hypothetical protein
VRSWLKLSNFIKATRGSASARASSSRDHQCALSVRRDDERSHPRNGEKNATPRVSYILGMHEEILGLLEFPRCYILLAAKNVAFSPLCNFSCGVLDSPRNHASCRLCAATVMHGNCKKRGRDVAKPITRFGSFCAAATADSTYGCSNKSAPFSAQRGAMAKGWQ